MERVGVVDKPVRAIYWSPESITLDTVSVVNTDGVIVGIYDVQKKETITGWYYYADIVVRQPGLYDLVWQGINRVETLKITGKPAYSITIATKYRDKIQYTPGQELNIRLITQSFEERIIRATEELLGTYFTEVIPTTKPGAYLIIWQLAATNEYIHHNIIDVGEVEQIMMQMQFLTEEKNPYNNLTVYVIEVSGSPKYKTVTNLLGVATLDVLPGAYYVIVQDKSRNRVFSNNNFGPFTIKDTFMRSWKLEYIDLPAFEPNIPNELCSIMKIRLSQGPTGMPPAGAEVILKQINTLRYKDQIILPGTAKYHLDEYGSADIPVIRKSYIEVTLPFMNLHTQFEVPDIEEFYFSDVPIPDKYAIVVPKVSFPVRIS